MSKKILISVLILFVLGAASQVQAIPVEWDGGGSDNGWHTPENWNPIGVPGTGDDVTIGEEGESVDINLNNWGGEDSNIEINSLETDGEVELGAWGVGWMQFTINDGLDNYGELEISTDGFISLIGDVTNMGEAFLELEGVEIEGTLANENDATVEVWGEAGFSDLDNLGTVEVDPFSEMWVENTLYNEGLIQLYGGSAESEDMLENTTDGIIKGFGLIGGEGTFINDGKIMAEGGTLVIWVEGTFVTTGVLSNQFVSSLQIDAVADVNNLGIIDVRSGGGIAINNDLNNRPGGVINLLGGTLAASGSITQSSGATFSGFGTIASQSLTIESGAVIELTGPTTIYSNVTIESGGTLIARAGQTIITGTTTNNGTILLAGGTVLRQGGYSGSGKIIEAAAPDAGVIIDNGDMGSSSTGTWKISGIAGYYDTDSLYSTNNGDEYSFEAWVAGARNISLWWTEHAGRSNNVSVEIYDGSTLIDTVTVNQRINGGQWNVLGIYSFSNKAKVKILSSGSGATVADAVEFAPASDIIIDNGDAGTSSVGTWRSSSIAGFYGSGSLYSTDIGASYSFETSVQVTSKVSLWWTAHPGRSTSVSIEIYDGSTLLDTVTVNQQINGGQWNELGTYSFGDKAKVKILSSGSGATVADAVKISPL